VDATAAVALAFNRALIEALLGDPRAVLDQLADVSRTSEHGFIAQQAATCDVLEGWARTRLGDPAGLEQAAAGTKAYDAGRERVLESMLRTFLADACITVGDESAVDLLERARAEALARNEVWWLAETLRLSAVADLRFAGGRRAGAWLEEAEQLATAQGATLLLPRIAASRVSPSARRPSAPRAPRPVRQASAPRRSP
jgi:hypothetical protein